MKPLCICGGEYDQHFGSHCHHCGTCLRYRSATPDAPARIYEGLMLDQSDDILREVVAWWKSWHLAFDEPMPTQADLDLLHETWRKDGIEGV